MTKSAKELAFLRDLYVSSAWTDRFTALAYEHFELPDSGKFLYLNSGVGNHAIAIGERLKKDVALYSAPDNIELQQIAVAKAEAVKAKINFVDTASALASDYSAALGDASLVPPGDLQRFVSELSAFPVSGGTAAFFTPTSGSFGEIYSYLWEVFLDGAEDHGANIEGLISELPTVSELEDMAYSGGLKSVKTHTNNEVFEYETGTEFVESPLIADFLMPRWLGFLDEKQKEQVAKKLAQLIDSERDGLTFRFSVKATILTGRKA